MADARKRAQAVEAEAKATPDQAQAPRLEAPARPPEARTELPASGLAEDILRGLSGAPEEQTAQAGAGHRPEGGIELPASGLAEEILGRPEARGETVADGLSLSIFGAPVREQEALSETTEHVACFLLEREEYGVDVRQVQEIRRVTEITSVPRAPEFVRGVINLRGRILPVLDLKKKLGLGEVAAGGRARIVVVRLRDRLLGLMVDGASQVLKIPVSRIAPPPEEVVEKGGDYIRAVAKLDDRLIILVDLERLLAHELKAGPAPDRAERGPVERDPIP